MTTHITKWRETKCRPAHNIFMYNKRLYRVENRSRYDCENCAFLGTACNKGHDVCGPCNTPDRTVKFIEISGGRKNATK